jgi:hypothetical protein
MTPAPSEKSLYDGLSKKDRQALSRELARIRREEEAKRRRRNRIVIITSIVVVAVLVVAGAGWAVYSSVRASFTGPLNMLSDGIVFTGDGTTTAATTTAAIEPGGEPVPSELDDTEVLRIAEYVDYASPDVSTFETANGAALQGYVSAGYASIELHPVALEGPGSYSARAANAFACVANTLPDAGLVVHNALVAAQPTLPDGGLDADGLVSLVQDAGISDETIASCIRGDEFSDWVTDATARAEAGIPNSDVRALSTVPLVVVDGTAYTGALDDTEALNTFITDVFTEASGAADAGDGTTDEGTTGDGTTGTPAPTPAPADGTAPAE